MLEAVTRNWWAVALRGLAAVLFGISAFVWPGVTLTALVLLFGAFALVDGAFMLVHAFRSRTNLRWVLGPQGLLGISAGVATMVWPEMTALVLVYFIAAWAIVTGILEIVAAVQLRQVIESEWLMGLGGLLSIVFGGVLVYSPGAGALALIWLIGSYALIFGVVLIALGFRIRAIGQDLAHLKGGANPPTDLRQQAA